MPDIHALEGRGFMALNDKNYSYEINNQAVRDYYQKVFDITQDEASTILLLAAPLISKVTASLLAEVGLSDFKQLIGVADSHDDIQNFEKFVLHPAIEEIELVLIMRLFRGRA